MAARSRPTRAAANVDYERLAREVDRATRARSTPRRTSVSVIAAAMSCRRSWPPPTGASSGFKAARRWLDDQRAEQAAPIPRERPKRVREAKRRMDEQLFTRVRARGGLPALPRQGQGSPRRAAGTEHGPQALHATGRAAGRDQHHRSRLAHGQGPARVPAGLQRPGRRERGPDRDRGRDRSRLTRLRAPRADRHRRPPRARARPASASCPAWSSPTPATGTPSRSNASPATASRSLIRPESGAQSTPRPGWSGGIYDFMRHVLASEHGKALYRQRQHIIESVFGNTKHNRGITRFHRRGRAAVRTEWRLTMATHNLLKLHKHHRATGGLTAAAGRDRPHAIPMRAARHPRWRQGDPSAHNARPALPRKRPQTPRPFRNSHHGRR